jgi:hypothetical protein
MRWTWGLALGLVLGCGDKSDEDSAETGLPTDSGGADGAADSGSGTTEFPDAAGNWTDICTYTFSITDVSGEYFLGLAETGAGSGGWYGEDCGAGNICHPMGFEGTALASVHPDCGGDGVGAVVAGSATLFHSALERDITYVLSDEAGNCWSWGDEPFYYEGCTVL